MNMQFTSKKTFNFDYSQFIRKFIFSLKKLLTDKNSVSVVKIKAFTLAETLLVIGIIGVVSALTLPNLNQSTGNKETVVKLKKIHSDLNTALGQAVIKYGPVRSWFAEFSEDQDDKISNKAAIRMGDFLKISKICDGNTGCFATGNAKWLNGTASGWNFNSDARKYKYVLADGAAVYWHIYRAACGDFKATGYDPENNVCGVIYVDLDGPKKGSGTFGKDIFEFVLATDGIYPMGMPEEPNCGKNNITNFCFKQGMYCTGWIFESDNMDYLDATNGVCPSGVTLSWSNLSCD